MRPVQPTLSRAALLHALSSFLHAGGRRGNEWLTQPHYMPAVLILFCGGVYGAVMASYHGLAGDRSLMVLYGALKIPMLFCVTLLTSVPCFYVLNLLSGVGDDFRAVWKGLIDYQLCVSIQLLALAPVTLFVNVTNGDYRTAQAFNTLLFAVAAINARRSLAACYRPLIQKNRVHQSLYIFWLVLYAFVGIQMAWDLRPFVGHPTMPVQFFRDDIGNAYMEMLHLVVLFYQEIFG
jgi:hypothetical protein